MSMYKKASMCIEVYAWINKVVHIGTIYVNLHTSIYMHRKKRYVRKLSFLYGVIKYV